MNDGLVVYVGNDTFNNIDIKYIAQHLQNMKMCWEQL